MEPYQELQIIAIMEVYHFGTATSNTVDKERALYCLEFRGLIAPLEDGWEMTNKGQKYVERLLATPKEG